MALSPNRNERPSIFEICRQAYVQAQELASLAEHGTWRWRAAVQLQRRLQELPLPTEQFNQFADQLHIAGDFARRREYQQCLNGLRRLAETLCHCALGAAS